VPSARRRAGGGTLAGARHLRPVISVSICVPGVLPVCDEHRGCSVIVMESRVRGSLPALSITVPATLYSPVYPTARYCLSLNFLRSVFCTAGALAASTVPRLIQ